MSAEVLAMNPSAPAPAPAEAPRPRPWLRFSGDINPGHMLQAGTVAVVLILWFGTGQNKTDNLAGTVADLKVGMGTLQGQVVGQGQTTRAEIKEAIAGVQTQITALPDLTARVRHAEEVARGLAERLEGAEIRGEARRVTSDSRFELLNAAAAEARVEIRQLRAETVEARLELTRLRGPAAVNLPGAPGVPGLRLR